MEFYCAPWTWSLFHLWILWSSECYATAVAVSFWFLYYLVLLNTHLKISRLCKWALRRLKKGITKLRWAIRIATGAGEAFTAEHGSGWNVAFFTNSSSKQLPGFRAYWLLGAGSAIHKNEEFLFSYITGFKPCFRTRTYVTLEVLLFLLYCGLFVPPHPAIIEVACCSCPSL